MEPLPFKRYRVHVIVVAVHARTIEATDMQDAYDATQDELDARGLERFEEITSTQCGPQIVAMEPEMGA